MEDYRNGLWWVGGMDDRRVQACFSSGRGGRRVILYDAWTAYKLDKRLHTAYPDKTQRKQAKFTSFAFGKVVKQTIPKRLMLVLLAFLAEHWVFIHVTIPLVVRCYWCNKHK
ncbi:hypothetical protein [Segatella sp.]|uniref:hypothetical protein n=1 Tax=Segatella sp. TaxID=2974253 RepID=UPI003AB0D362